MDREVTTEDIHHSEIMFTKHRHSSLLFCLLTFRIALCRRQSPLVLNWGDKTTHYELSKVYVKVERLPDEVFDKYPFEKIPQTLKI